MVRKKNTAKGLLLGSTTKAAITVAREWKKLGIEVSVVDWFEPFTKYSKYFDHYYLTRSPEINLNNFMEDFMPLLVKNKFDFVLPIHDLTLEIAIKFEKEISKFSMLVGVNPPEIHELVHDKSKLLEISNSVGIESPKTIIINEISELQSRLKEFS